MSRKDSPVSLLPLTSSDKLVSVASVNKSDKIMVYRKIGEPIELDVSEISPSMRVAKADKLIKVPKGDIVVGIKVLSSK